MVNTATTSRMRAGMIVHPISRGVLPWICFGFSFLPAPDRYLMATNTVAASTPIPMTVATRKTGTKRLSIVLAAGPWGSRLFWPLSGPRQPARTATAPSASETATHRLARETRLLMSLPPWPGIARTLTWPSSGPANECLCIRERGGGVADSIAEPIEGRGTALPVALHADAGLEVDADTEQRLELAPGLGAGGLEHGAATPDDDALLRLPLDAHGRPQAQEIGACVRFVVVDLAVHRDRMGQLVAGDGDELLAQDLGREHGLGLVGDHAFRVVGRALGEPGLELVDEGIRARARLGRQRHEGVVVAELPRRRRQLVGDGCLPDRVDLVHDEHRGGLDPVHDLGDEAVAAADRRGGVDDVADHVDLGQGREGALVGALPERGAGLVQPGRVEEHDLTDGLVRAHPADLAPGGLGTIRSDRDLGANQAVHQRRLADIGSTDDGHEPRSEPAQDAGASRTRWAGRPPVRSPLGAGRIWTLTIRWPCTRSVWNWNPWKRMVSPSSGTLPSRLNTRPPTVSHSSSGSSIPSSSFTSSIAVRPGTRSAPPGRCSTRGSSMSYSSAISPTISSSRSSIVTRPAVPPCSSTTIAMWNCWRCISRRSSATRFCSGTNVASRSASRTGAPPSSCW